MPLFLGNTNKFQVRGAKNSATGSYINNAATATWELRTAENGGGSSVASGTLTYVTSSNGVYDLVIPSSTSLTLGTIYYVSAIVVDSSVTPNVQLKLEQPVTALLRRGHTPNA